jgi:hypothetical protein
MSSCFRLSSQQMPHSSAQTCDGKTTDGTLIQDRVPYEARPIRKDERWGETVQCIQIRNNDNRMLLEDEQDCAAAEANRTLSQLCSR